MAISTRGEEEALWLRTSIIEGVGQLEAGLDQVIAMHFSLDEGHREILEKDLLPRVRLSARISTLTKLLDWHMRLENYPFFALLPKAIEHRNVVAHMTLDIFESSDKWLVFSGWRQGEMQTKKLLMIDLRRSDAAIWHATIDLNLLYDRFIDELRADDVSDLNDLYGG